MIKQQLGQDLMQPTTGNPVDNSVSMSDTEEDTAAAMDDTTMTVILLVPDKGREDGNAKESMGAPSQQMSF